MGTVNTLHRTFFNRPTEVVARELLGKILVRKIGSQEQIGKIVEVEAYLGESDPAAHAYKGKTKRTEVLYGEPGRAYIYQIHRYHCLNVSVEKEGYPGCVLIRALEPVHNIKESVSGPGRLCRTLCINKELYGVDMTDHKSSLYIVDTKEKININVSPRIGITKAIDWPLRFFVKDNPYVSR